MGGHRAPAPQISWHIDDNAACTEDPEITLVPPAPPVPPTVSEGESDTEVTSDADNGQGLPEPTELDTPENQVAAAEDHPGEENAPGGDDGAQDLESHEVPAQSNEPVSEIKLLQKDAEGLQSISSLVGQDAVLLWSDNRGRICEALLKEEGVIDPGDGQLTDQVQAAFEKVGGDSSLDGWEAFRIGNLQGPSLAEAIAEVNTEIERNSAPHQRKHGH